jgi:uncharacterized protein YkwD
MNVSRRTLIIAFAALPAGLAFAEDDRERMAEKLIEQAVNEGRKRLAPELPALVAEPMLDAIARERSADMSHGAPFAHEDLRGGYPAIEKIRARYSRIGAMGENIMMTFDPAGTGYDAKKFAASAVKSWFDSEGHRGNILSAAFTHCGTGVAASRTTVYATQVFWGAPPQRQPHRS